MPASGVDILTTASLQSQPRRKPRHCLREAHSAREKPQHRPHPEKPDEPGGVLAMPLGLRPEAGERRRARGPEAEEIAARDGLPGAKANEGADRIRVGGGQQRRVGDGRDGVGRLRHRREKVLHEFGREKRVIGGRDQQRQRGPARLQDREHGGRGRDIGRNGPYPAGRERLLQLRKAGGERRVLDGDPDLAHGRRREQRVDHPREHRPAGHRNERLVRTPCRLGDRVLGAAAAAGENQRGDGLRAHAASCFSKRR